MINLLPEDRKKQLIAAHTNTIIIRYIFTVIIASFFLGIILIGSYYIMNDSKVSAEKTITDIKSNNSSYSPTINTSDNFTKNLSTASNILNNRISYSKILNTLINTLPNGVILSSPISIDSSALGSPVVLTAFAKSASDEPLLKASIENSSIFSGYSLKSLDNNSSKDRYPSKITFSVMINGKD